MGELTDLLQKLKISSGSNDDVSLHDQLRCLIDKIHEKEDVSAVCEEIVKEDVLLIAKKALETGSKDNQSLAAELVAELAKVENCRILCVESSVVPILVEKMASTNNETALQACRSLGNICYEHDGGRLCVIEAGGTPKLLSLLQRAAELPDDPHSHQLRLVATGFLLNLLNLYEAAEEHPIDSLLLDVLCQYLDKYASDEDIPTHVLLSFSCLVDCEISRELIISRNIAPQLLNILKSSKSPEVIETCLELITNLAETGEIVKTQLATSGICDAIVSVIHHFIELPETDLSSPIIKTATDLLVLILVGDESMNLLYKNGEGSIYKVMVDWLASSNEYLQITASLAMGNFARSDTHCMNMVQSGVTEKLLALLAKNNTSDGDIRLQHALLSALRNLCIAPQNKPLIIKQKALDTLLPMVSSIETYPVVFKLLATLRMMIDGQKNAACEIGSSSEVIERIVSWCKVSEHPGVQGESSRILSWIVKNCDKAESVIDNFEKCDAISPLIDMLESSHNVMINEASLALALVFVKLNASSLSKILSNSSFMKCVVIALKKPDLPPEVICTLLSSVYAISISENFLEKEEIKDLKSAVNSYSDHSNSQVKDLVLKLNEKFGCEK